MSGIEFNFVGPFLQAPQQASDAARVRDAEANRAEGAHRDAARMDEVLGKTVETAEDATVVDNESEGLGSQGRPFGRPEEESSAAGQESDAGVTHDEQGRPHIDLEA